MLTKLGQASRELLPLAERWQVAGNAKRCLLDGAVFRRARLTRLLSVSRAASVISTSHLPPGSAQRKLIGFGDAYFNE